MMHYIGPCAAKGEKRHSIGNVIEGGLGDGLMVAVEMLRSSTSFGEAVVD